MMSKEHDGMSPASLMMNIALRICKMQDSLFSVTVKKVHKSCRYLYYQLQYILCGFNTKVLRVIKLYLTGLSNSKYVRITKGSTLASTCLPSPALYRREHVLTALSATL